MKLFKAFGRISPRRGWSNRSSLKQIALLVLVSAVIQPTAFNKLIADDHAKWLPIVKASGAKAD